MFQRVQIMTHILEKISNMYNEILAQFLQKLAMQIAAECGT